MTSLYYLEFAKGDTTYLYAGCFAILFWTLVIYKFENTHGDEMNDLLENLQMKRVYIRKLDNDLTDYEKKKIEKKNINMLKEAYRNPNYNMW